MDKAREIAMLVLMDVHENDAYANVSLARELKKSPDIKDIDRRFATELVYGAVKAGDTLDWIIKKYSTKLVKKLSPIVRAALRLGVYQLFFLDKVPPSAAVNEMVELVKKHEKRIGASKYVNAVLRTAVREPERAKFPSAEDDDADSIALTMMHPRWLVKRWIGEFGVYETKKLCAFDNEPAVLSIRANTLKTSRNELMMIMENEGATVESSKWATEGILCTKHGNMDTMKSLADGLWQAQDESSMMVAHILEPKPGELVIDACSAPGGKTTHIAAMMKNDGRVIAADIYEAKLKTVEENAARLGIDIVETINMDAREIGEEYEAMADRVLIDAPCSGLGVLRRRPDARWRKRLSEINKLPKLQSEILESAARAVKAGGVIVYSTCTMNHAENEDVVRAFLARHDEFALENAGQLLPIKKRDEEMIQLYPQRDGVDGFFIARMRRKV